MKIGQHLTKIWTKVWCQVLSGLRCKSVASR